MEYDLHQGLHDLAQTPPVGPLAAGDVTARVRRGRTLRTTAVALASAAVIVGAAVLVSAAPWDTTPIPPATPTPAPTQDPTPGPTPEPTPEPTEDPDETAPDTTADEPPIVALTSAGDVLVLDPNSGEILRTHATVGDETPFGWAPVTTDQAFAYLVRDDEVRRVDLTNGAVEVVAPGYAPAISPDGKLLAYIGPDESGDRTTDALWLVDQETGARHSLSAIAETELELPRPSWSRDGATLYLSYDLEPDIRAVPIAADGTPLTDEATTLRAPRGEDGYATEFWSLATSLPDGDLVRVSAPVAYDSPPSEISVQRVSLTTGSTTTIEELSGTEVVGLAAEPQGGALLAVVATRDGDRLQYSLVRWDAGGSLRTLAVDVVGVAW